MAPAGSSRVGSFASTLHFLGETHEGTLRHLARRVRSWLVKHQSQFFVAVAQFNARDDRLPLLGFQTLERLLVRFDLLTPDCCLQWRAWGLGFDAVEIRQLRLAPFAAQFIAQTIEYGITQVCLQRTHAPRLEALDLPKRSEQRVLHKIVGVGEVARPVVYTPRRHAI